MGYFNIRKWDVKERVELRNGHFFAREQIFAVLATFGLSASRHAIAAGLKIIHFSNKYHLKIILGF